MANRNATPNFTFEQWRVEFNNLSDDLGDFNSGITGSIPSGSNVHVTTEDTVLELIDDVNKIIDGTHQFTGDITFQSDVHVTGNLTLEGNITIGDQDTDTINLGAELISSIIPDSTNTFDIGSSLKGWRNLFVTTQATLASANVEDLTDNRIVISGASGELEDDENFRFDATNFDIGPAGNETFRVTVASGNTSVGGDLTVDGDLTVNGVTTTVRSTVTTVEDPVFTLGGETAPTSADNKDRGIEFQWYDGLTTTAKIGFFGFDDSSGKFTFIPNASNTGEVFSGTSGDVVFGNGYFTGLTTDNIQIAITDDNTIDTTSGNLKLNSVGGTIEIDDDVTISGIIDVDAQATLASVNVEDLTSGRVVLTGTNGELQDSGELTYTQGINEINVDIIGDLDVDNININGNTIISTDTDGNINLTPDGVGEVVLSTAIVSDLSDNRIVIAGTNSELEDDANFRFDGTDLLIGAAAAETFTVNVSTGNTAIAGTLDVTGDTGIDGNFAIATNKFTIDSLTGDAFSAGNISSTLDITAGQDLYVTRNSFLQGTTGATNTTSGALVVSGGAGIAENLYVGGDVVASGNIFIQTQEPVATESFSIAISVALS